MNAQHNYRNKPSTDDQAYEYYLRAKQYVTDNFADKEAWAWVIGTVVLTLVVWYTVGWWGLVVLLLVPVFYYLYQRFKPKQQTLIEWLRENLTQGRMDRDMALKHIRMVRIWARG